MKTATRKKQNSSLRILSLPGKEFGGNPYINLFCRSLERTGINIVNIHALEAKYFNFDVLHVHWPEFYVTERPFSRAIVSAPTILVYLAATKLLRKKIVWTVHDVTPMKARHPWLLRIYLLGVRVLVDAYVFLTPSSEAEFKRMFPLARKKPAWHVPHGRYPVPATPERRRAELRQRLSRGANCLLVGFFGEIRPYKNAEVLAYLPHQDSIGRELKIVVAGAADPTYDTAEIEAPLDRIPPKLLVRIKERLPDQDLADMIRAVDVVLLPYIRGSNSGFSMLVLSCRQRLICSALPMFIDLMHSLGPPWVHVFDHRTKDLSAELEAALWRFQHDIMDTEAKSRLETFLDNSEFDLGAQRLRQLYKELIN